MPEPHTDHAERAGIAMSVSHPASVWRRAILLALLCIALAVVAVSTNVHKAVLHLLAACQDVIAGYPVVGPVVFILFAALSAMLAFVSVAVVVPIAAFAWGPALAILYLWLGWVVGGLVSYAAGRWLGRTMLMWLSRDALQRLDRLVRRDGSFALTLLLQLSLPSELLGYTLGAARYSFLNYLLILALGEAPYAIGAVTLGENFLAGRAGVLAAAGVVFAALIVIAFKVMDRRLARVNELASASDD